MKYKVYECEEKLTATGKALKKLVLQGEGKQYPDKNVTMWADHPLFEDTVVGITIDVELDVKDSTAPNPHGGFYKNKTVINTQGRQRDAEPQAAQENNSPNNAEIKNLLTFKVIPQLEAIWGRLGLILKNSTQVNPDETPFGDFKEPTF